MLAAAIGPALTKYMHELLDLMFYYGIYEALIVTLEDLCKYVPPLKPGIQDRLLYIVSCVLSPSYNRGIYRIEKLSTVLNLPINPTVYFIYIRIREMKNRLTLH